MKFYVINGTQKTQVNPGGDWKIKPTREDNSVGFRFKFSGNIVLTDKDFDVIRAVELTDKFKKLYIEIWREVDGFYQKFWYGYFTPFTCKWNLQNSTVEFTPTVIDDYTNLVEGFEIEKNILDIDPADQFVADILGNTETLTFTEDINVAFFPVGQIPTSYNTGISPLNWGGVAPNVAFIEPYNNTPNPSKYYQFNGLYKEPVFTTPNLTQVFPAFYQKPSVNITASEIGADITTQADKENAAFILYKMNYELLSGTLYRVTMTLIRQIMITKDVNGLPSPPSSGTWVQAEQTEIAGLPAHKYVRITSEFNSQLNASQNFTLRNTNAGSFYYTRTLAGGSQFDSGRWLNDVINFFLNEFQLTLKSDFLQSTVNPVTGESDNPTRLLQILQKSDAKYPSATEPATRGFYKFSELITDICVLFNLRWWVEGDYFRIEHVSTLPDSNDVDATIYSGNKNARSYTYDSDNIPHRQTLVLMDSTDDIDFEGLPIEYSAENTSGRTKDNSLELRVSNISTDIAQMILSPSEVTNEGFALVSVENNNGIYSLRDELGILSGRNKSNGYLTVSNIISKFYNHDMPLPTATVNGEQKTFASTQRRRKQEGVTFPYTEINGFSLVKTELGWGEIDDAELDLKTMLYTTTLKHD